MFSLSPEEAAERIKQGAEAYERKESYFPALDHSLLLDEGRVALDLGHQEDFFAFMNQLDRLLLGGSRLDLSHRVINKPIGGFNTIYPFYKKDSRVLVHAYFYSLTDNAALNWHIRGHEEGHVINAALGDLSQMSSIIGAPLIRYDSESVPQVISTFAVENRELCMTEVLDEQRKYNNRIDSGDYFLPLYGIVPDNDLERMIIRSAVFFTGVRERRLRDNTPIGSHIKEVLNHIDVNHTGNIRQELRIIALMHDLGKQVTNHLPRGASGKMPHSFYSAKMAEDFHLPERLVEVIRFHDHHAYAFRRANGEKPSKAKLRKNTDFCAMKGVDQQLMLQFNRADSVGRSQDEVAWIEEAVAKAEL